jgi:hypothetical protein
MSDEHEPISVEMRIRKLIGQKLLAGEDLHKISQKSKTQLTFSHLRDIQEGKVTATWKTIRKIATLMLLSNLL